MPEQGRFVVGAESWRWSSLRRVSAKTRPSPSSRRGLCLAAPIGCKLSTNRKRKPKWRRCVAASIAVGPSAILTGSRTRPSDWGWNGRFGPVESRRNNRKLATVTCTLCSTNVRPLCAARRLSRQVITTESTEGHRNGNTFGSPFRVVPCFPWLRIFLRLGRAVLSRSDSPDLVAVTFCLTCVFRSRRRPRSGRRLKLVCAFR